MSFFALVMVGCGVRLPDPVVDSVEPNRGWIGEETVLSIEGANFYPEVQLDLNRRDLADLDRGFSAWLVSDGARVPLSAVGAVDYEHLSAVVPPGLDLGVYDLVVEGPSGRLGGLPDAFTALPTRADRIALTSASGGLTFGEVAIVDIVLVDPENEPVFQDLEVEVRVRGISGPIVVDFGAQHALENQVESPDGLVITGFLGADGRARLPIGFVDPGIGVLEVTVDPLAPASPIGSGLITLGWEPGAIDHIEFELPSSTNPTFAVDAGSTFLVDVLPVDASGNVIPDATGSVVVQTACGDWTAQVLLQGATTVDVTPTRATDFDNCPEQFLRVLGGAPNGESDRFNVRAGPAVSFDVTVNVNPSVGVPFDALVSPRDAWGNRTAWSGDLEVDDTVGGVRDVVCARGPFSFDDQECEAVSTVSGSGVQLVASSGPVAGMSDPYDVLPGTDVAALEVVALGPAIAGEPLPVAVRMLDAFGNTIPAGPGMPVLGLTDEIGQAACDDTTPLPDGRAGFACVLLTARTGASLRASIGPLIASSPQFNVVNGELALAVLSAPSTAMAGAPFTVGVELADAWGNPYLVQTVPTIEVGTLNGVREDLVLEPDGSGEVELTLFHSGAAVLSAWSGGDEIGVPTQVFIQPGASVRYLVEPGPPWGWVGQATEVRVTAVDAWDNRTNAGSTVTLATLSGEVSPIDVTLVNGAVSVALSWSEPVFDEEIEATGDGLDGLSEPFHVVEACGAAGPTAGVDFASAPTGRACLEPGEASASVAISFASSSPGVAPLAIRAVSVEQGAAVDSASGAFSFDVTQIGRSDVQALVADAAGCGAVVETAVWAGPDDGGAVGALPVVVDTPIIAVGVGSTALRVVGAVDCTGDPASGAPIAVRSDRGEIVGAQMTGAGLQLVLDASGTGSVVLDAGLVSTGGTGTVWFAAPAGGAEATRSVEVSGDDRPPTVWSQTPSGAVEGEVDSVVLQFDEPLLAPTVVVSGFSVGGTGSVAVGAVSLLDPTRVEVVFETPVDATSGWFLQAEDSLRDQAGNLLHGGLDGAPGPWLGPFGGAPGSVDGASCALDLPRFRPDGDPGLGEEADEVVLQMSSSSAPAAWVVSVRDGGGTLIARERLSASAPDAVWAWDGRDVGEKIVADGSYTLSVEPDDGLGNRGTACVAVVVVDNEVGP